MTLTKAEVLHVQRALDEYKQLLYAYPELFTDRVEDELKIALEIME